jgi:hypothetical protein
MEVSGQLHASAALPPEEEEPHTPWIRGWVGTRTSLDAVAKRKYPHHYFYRESIPGRPTRSLVFIRTDLTPSPEKMSLCPKKHHAMKMYLVAEMMRIFAQIGNEKRDF